MYIQGGMPPSPAFFPGTGRAATAVAAGNRSVQVAVRDRRTIP